MGRGQEELGHWLREAMGAAEPALPLSEAGAARLREAVATVPVEGLLGLAERAGVIDAAEVRRLADLIPRPASWLGTAAAQRVIAAHADLGEAEAIATALEEAAAKLRKAQGQATRPNPGAVPVLVALAVSPVVPAAAAFRRRLGIALGRPHADAASLITVVTRWVTVPQGHGVALAERCLAADPALAGWVEECLRVVAEGTDGARDADNEAGPSSVFGSLAALLRSALASHTSGFARNRADVIRYKQELRMLGEALAVVAQHLISDSGEQVLSEGMHEVLDEQRSGAIPQFVSEALGIKHEDSHASAPPPLGYHSDTPRGSRPERKVAGRNGVGGDPRVGGFPKHSPTAPAAAGERLDGIRFPPERRGAATADPARADGAPASIPAGAEAHSVAGTPVDRELLDYLEHVALHPFLPALDRDRELGLTKYKGSLLRQRLLDEGHVRRHKVSTGRRSGQLVLLEVTPPGLRLLASMKIRVQRPRRRGSFLHRYYRHKIKEYAEAAWPEASVETESAHGGTDRVADVAVRVSGDAGQPRGTHLAFAVVFTGGAKEVRRLLRDVELFDRIIVCAETEQVLESMKARAMEALDSQKLQRVSFGLIGPYLAATSPSRQSSSNTASRAPTGRSAVGEDHGSTSGLPSQRLTPRKSGTRPETERERREQPPESKRGRKRRTPLLQQVAEAYAHLHDLDWLERSPLVELEAVQERVDPRHPMPDAQALRGILVEAAQESMKHMAPVTSYAPLRLFVERYLQGKKVAQIARELGVTREWCSRHHRKEALRLASLQFARLAFVKEDQNQKVWV